MGFFRKFELLCSALECDEERKKAYLLSKLEGAAQALVDGKGDAALLLGYEGLKQLVLQHFLGEQSMHVRALQRLRLGGDIVKFNKDFALAAAAATPLLGEWGVKDTYLQAVEGRLGGAIRLAQKEPLQVVMASALDLDSSRSRASGAQSSNTHQNATNLARPQNPDRIKCTKCNWWHHKDAPCRKVDSRRPQGPPRNNRPRVMEADVAPEPEHDAAYDDYHVEE